MVSKFDFNIYGEFQSYGKNKEDIVEEKVEDPKVRKDPR